VLAVGDNTKAIWGMIKTMRVSVDRVREERRQKLYKDFNNLTFKSGETIEDFSMHVSTIVAEL
jgi:hypothetical protein